MKYILFINYLGVLFKKKTRKLELRFWIVTFLHGLYTIQRWKDEIMSLYLHNIWIHWPKDFRKIDFQQEGTDIHEAWLAICKKILRYNTDRKKENGLSELMTRLAIEDLVNKETVIKEEKWDKISKAFKQYKWREIFIPAEKVVQFKNTWLCFIQRLQNAGYSQQQGDFIIDQRGIQFFSLPLDK